MTAHEQNMDDTSRCPLGPRCEGCGIELGEALRVHVVGCAIGSMCLTLCPRCGRSSEDKIAMSTALRLVQQHARHLGIELSDEAVLRSWPPTTRFERPHYRWLRA